MSTFFYVIFVLGGKKMRKNNTRSPEEKEIIGYGLVSRRGAARSYYDGLNQVLNKIKEDLGNEFLNISLDTFKQKNFEKLYWLMSVFHPEF